jgi:MFS family permease
VLLGAAHSLNHSLFWILPLYLIVVVEEFGTSVETIGFVAGASTLIYGVGGIAGGSLSDKFGEVKTITLGIALSGISTFIFLLAKDVTGFTVGLLLMAVFASLYHPIANSLISKVFQMNIGGAMGVHGTGGNIGVMFAPIAAVALGALWNWRLPFVFFGLLSLSVSILFLKVSPLNLEKTRVTSKTRDVIKIPGLWALLIYNIAVGLYYKGFDFIFPTFLMENREFSRAVSGLIVSGTLGVGILGQLLGGRASDLFGSKKTLIATSIGVTLGMVFLQAISQPIPSVVVFILIYGFSFYAHQPAFNSLVGLITPDDLRGKVFGILFSCSFGLGSVSMVIASVFVGRYSLESALYVMALFSFAAFLLSFLLPARAKRSRGQDK